MKNREKIEPQRDIKGRFIKGTPPGPGRGKKKARDDEIDLFDLLENAVKEGLSAKDLKDRITAARAGTNLLKLKGPVKEEGPILHPFVSKFMSLMQAIAGNYEGLHSGLDVIKRMNEVCPGCGKLGNYNPDEELPFCTYDDGCESAWKNDPPKGVIGVQN